MIKFSEYVSLGHPDKIADYISQYILDRYIERDPLARYAVEAQVKGYRVTLGGEVSSSHHFGQEEIQRFVRDAVHEIGYTREYQSRWGEANTICGDLMEVTSLISQQSEDIAQGLDGWGDQGVFFGYSEYRLDTCGMPLDHTIAKRLCKTLFDSGIGGLDIKTQVFTENDTVKKVIVAIPLLTEADKDSVKDLVRAAVDGDYDMIVNGTGRYVEHSTIADCGTTGRKLVVDFYGGNCKIGGGSPWTKDASKADLTLNLVARNLAITYANAHKTGATVSLASCIGRQEVDVSVQNEDGELICEGTTIIVPQEYREKFKLNTPIYTSMCRWGLFGEYQQDKIWENEY